VASEPKLVRDLRRDRMWRRLRVSTEVVRVWLLSLNRSEERLSCCANLFSRRSQALRRSATRVVRKGPGVQRWLGQLRVSGSPAEAGPGRDLSRGSLPKQAGSGTFREVGVSMNRISVRLWFQRRASRRSARLKARTRRGQAALPIAAGAWEARRATGYG
jgi:hypothetical protein